MPGSPSQTPPTPLPIFENINAFHRTAAIKAAIELDIFTAIGEGTRKSEAIGARCGAAPRGARILCDFLTVCGLLQKNDDGYALTPETAAFLDKRSPAYMGTVHEFLASDLLFENMRNLTDSVRKGGTSNYDTVSHENPIWVTFANAMAPMMGKPAEGIAALIETTGGAPARVLDVAAGHGLFGIAIARRFPEAVVTALDWSHVLEVARENARQAGVDGRFSTIAGSAFDASFGGPYDVVLLTNFLHHFDTQTCDVLLRKVRASLAPGGRTVTLEFIPEDDRLRPTMSAMFSLVMLAGTEAGDAYTYREIESMFSKAGFARSELHEIPFTVQQVVVSWV